MIKFYIERGKSKKSGNLYTALRCKINDTIVTITFDSDIILRVLDIPPSEFAKLCEGIYELN